MDGVDAVLCRIQEDENFLTVNILLFHTFPYPQEIRQRLSRVVSAKTLDVNSLCRLHFRLGQIFAQAVLSLLERSDLKPQEIDVIGSHGQTIRHLPTPVDFLGEKVSATWQLGELDVIAKRTGIVTVGDFRPGDMALGGQGAPLVPYFDYRLFSHPERNRCLLNIGGIANVTVLKAGGSLQEVWAFDTGPGNMVVDELARRLFHRPFDPNGKWALQGRVSKELLEWAWEHPYFHQSPPKSTGRETFGRPFVNLFLQKAKSLRLSPVDTLTTASELTVQAIVRSARRYIDPVMTPDEWIVSGGGVHNSYLLSRLKALLGAEKVKVSDEFGIPADAKEALCFALLARETLMGRPTSIPGVTGCQRPAVLGKICYP